METKKAPRITPTPDKGEQVPSIDGTQYDASRQLFYSAALSMSWQLAVVVLVPVIGGFKLDQHYKTVPLWTLIGFALAIGGMVFVLKRALSDLNQRASSTTAVTKAKVKHV